jgi:N-acetylglucosamine-6-phosphate deacetylase
MKALINVNAVLERRIVNDAVIAISGSRIAGIYHGDDVPPLSDFDEIIDGQGAFAGPGFVDLHCHAGGDYYFYENPEAAAAHHLAGGTTSMNCTINHDIGRQGALDAMDLVRRQKDANRLKNVIGIHFEGPFLNPKYGAHSYGSRAVDPEEYRTIIKRFGDLITLWTVAPELDGAFAFIREALAAGIAVAIGHTEASMEVIDRTVDLGARVCTHVTNATGTSISPTRYGGTLEVSVDMACILRDEVFLEVINDRNGLHVRPGTLRFLIQAAGLDRICGVTDACTGVKDDTDVNLEPEGLCGSKLTMNVAARNFRDNAGLSMCEIFRVCSLNPARALRMDNQIGSLEPGKLADLVLIDSEYNVKSVLLKGEKVI